MQTTTVYAVLVLLLAVAWLRTEDTDHIVPTLATSFVLSALAGHYLAGFERAAWAVFIDLGVVYGMRLWCHGKRAYFVGLFGLLTIGIRLSYVGAYGEIPHGIKYTYAAAVNCAFAAQVLIGGGFADALGARIHDWIDRVHPRWAGVLRHVVH